MAHFEFYRAVWDFLDEEGILEDIIDEMKMNFGEETISKIQNTWKIADFAIEYGLFNMAYQGIPCLCFG